MIAIVGFGARGYLQFLSVLPKFINRAEKWEWGTLSNEIGQARKIYLRLRRTAKTRGKRREDEKQETRSQSLPSPFRIPTFQNERSHSYRTQSETLFEIIKTPKLLRELYRN